MKGTLRFKRKAFYNNIWIDSFYHLDCHHEIASHFFFTETSPNSRAKCNRCKVKIMKGQKRNYTCYIYNGHRRRKFFHEYCTITGGVTSRARGVRPRTLPSTPRTPRTRTRTRTPCAPRTQGDGNHQRCSAATWSAFHVDNHGEDWAIDHTDTEKDQVSLIDLQSINNEDKSIIDLQSIDSDIEVFDAGADNAKASGHDGVNDDDVIIIDL